MRISARYVILVVTMLLALALALSACEIPDPFVATTSSGSGSVMYGPTVVEAPAFSVTSPEAAPQT